MATCPYGASVNPSYNPAAVVVVSRRAWETYTGTASSWLDPLLDTVTPSEITLSALATLNPDDPADLSASVIALALAGDPIALAEVEVWAKAKLTYLEFTLFCICNGNPTAYTCATQPYVISETHTYTPDGNTTWTIPDGTTCLRWQAYGHDLTGGSSVFNMEIWVQRGSTYQVNIKPNANFNPNVTQGPEQFSYAFQSGDQVKVYISSLRSGGSVKVDWSFAWYSNGVGPTSSPSNPTTPTQPTTLILPPDWSCSSTSDVCTRLQQISDRLDFLRSEFRTFQRYALPFAYIADAVHSGLTSAGSFAISRLVGMRLELTATDPAQPVLPGNPPYQWNAGWVSLNDANGMIAELRLTRASQEWLHPLFPAATSFNYALAAGFTLRATELDPEP